MAPTTAPVHDQHPGSYYTGRSSPMPGSSSPPIPWTSCALIPRDQAKATRLRHAARHEEAQAEALLWFLRAGRPATSTAASPTHQQWRRTCTPRFHETSWPSRATPSPIPASKDPMTCLLGRAGPGRMMLAPPRGDSRHPGRGPALVVRLLHGPRSPGQRPADLDAVCTTRRWRFNTAGTMRLIRSSSISRNTMTGTISSSTRKYDLMPATTHLRPMDGE